MLPQHACITIKSLDINDIISCLEANKETHILMLFDRSGSLLYEHLSHLINGYATLRILVVTSDPEQDHLFRLTQTGIQGIVAYDEASKAQLSQAIEKLVGNHKHFSTQVYETLLTKYMDDVQSKKNGTHALTSRELEILKLISEGLTNATIAKKMKVSFSTVKNHRLRILGKLNCSNTAELIRVAFQKGILLLPQRQD